MEGAETEGWLRLESDIFLSLVIPAYNEAGRLGDTLEKVRTYRRASLHPTEIVVVDDGSRDGTAALAAARLWGQPRARVLRYQPNRGKGWALRVGIGATRGRYVLFTDADLSTPLEFAVPLVEELQRGADLALGSRGQPDSRILLPQPLYRRLAARAFNRLRDAALGTSQFVDSQCGFKAFRGNLARFLFSRVQVEGFMFDVEVLHLALQLGCRIREVPVDWTDAPGSKLRVVRDTARMVRDLVAIRVNHRDLAPGRIPALVCEEGRRCPLRPQGREALPGACPYTRCPVLFQDPVPAATVYRPPEKVPPGPRAGGENPPRAPCPAAPASRREAR